MQPSFSESDHSRIESSVASAESRTSGEIVPYLVASSDNYSVTRWRSSVLFLSVAMVLSFGIKNFYEGWSTGWLYTSWGIAIVGISAVLVGLAAVELLPSYKRLLAGQGPMARIVHLSAMRAFVEEEVFKTRDRSGILIFVSLFEHRVEVIGDEGINKAVEQREWEEVVDLIIAGIRSGELTQGIIDGIEKCGQLLQTHGVEIAPGDTDELSNRMRVRKRM